MHKNVTLLPHMHILLLLCESGLSQSNCLNSRSWWYKMFRYLWFAFSITEEVARLQTEFEVNIWKIR